jgi:circadian clock protein KaiB
LEQQHKYHLVLFITGASPNSVRAIANLKAICAQYLEGDCVLEIIDVYQHPEVAQEEQIIALPTLINKGAGGTRRLVGDLSDTKKVLRGLGIITEEQL